ncbi:MAG: transposase [Sphingopyxis sp.]|nr:transposase [Sphingopyxis sp.]
MKINVEVDCTPEEARRLFGLPDLTPLHAIYLSRVEKLMEKGITPDLAESMVKNWVPMGEAGMGLVQSLLGQFGGAMLGAGKKAGDDDVKPSAARKR